MGERPSEDLYLEENRGKKPWLKRPLTWVAVGVIAAGGAGYGIIRHHQTASAATGTQIRWLQASRGNVSKTTSFSGTLNPVNQATVTSTGTLTSVSVKVGDKVTKGQVIAHTDTTSAKTQVTLDEASVSQAKAKLAQDEETTTTTNAQGQSQTQSPDANVVAQAKAALSQAEAQLTEAEDTLAACTIKSPISGTVVQVASVNGTSSSTSSSGSSGSSSSSGNTVAVITDLSSSDFEVQADVAQADVASIHKGQTATISLSSDGGPELTGTVESVGLIPTTSSGVTTYPVVVSVNKPSSSSVTMLPGASVTVDVVEQQVKNVIEVPTAAIVNRGGQTGVYVATSSATSASSQSSSTSNSTSAASSSSQSKSYAGASKVPNGLTFQAITVGLYGGNMVQVKSGLTAGEEVAIVLPTSTSSSSSSSSTKSSSGLSGLGAVTGGFGGGGGNFGGSSGRSFSGSSGGGRG